MAGAQVLEQRNAKLAAEVNKLDGPHSMCEVNTAALRVGAAARTFEKRVKIGGEVGFVILIVRVDRRRIVNTSHFKECEI